MNCRNTFQIYLNIENCMTNRASMKVLLNKIFTLQNIKLVSYMIVPFFQVDKSIAQVSWWHGIRRHCNAFLHHVSWQDMLQRIHPNGRHTWLHCRVRNGDIWNLVFPCGHSNYLIAQIGKWKATYLHMQVSYLVNQNGKNHRFRL